MIETTRKASSLSSAREGIFRRIFGAVREVADGTIFLSLFLLALIVAMSTAYFTGDALGHYLSNAVEFTRGNFVVSGTSGYTLKLRSPANWSVLAALFILPTGDLRFIHIPGVLFFVPAAVILSNLARRQKLTLLLSVSSTLILVNPLALSYLYSGQADFMYATLFGAAWLAAALYCEQQRVRFALLAGAAVGLLISTKSEGVCYGSIVFLAVLVVSAYYRRCVSTTLKHLTLGVFVAIPFASLWLVRNWIGYSEPAPFAFISGHGLASFQYDFVNWFLGFQDKMGLLFSAVRHFLEDNGILGTLLAMAGFARIIKRWVSNKDNLLEILLIFLSVGIFMVLPLSFYFFPPGTLYPAVRRILWVILYLQARALAGTHRWQVCLLPVLLIVGLWNLRTYIGMGRGMYILFIVVLMGACLALMIHFRPYLRPAHAAGLLAGTATFFLLISNAYGPSGKIELLSNRFYRLGSASGNGAPIKVLDQHTEIKRLVYINRQILLPLYGTRLTREIVHELCSNLDTDNVVVPGKWTAELDARGVDAVVVAKRTDNLHAYWNQALRHGVRYERCRSILLESGWRLLWESRYDAVFVHPKHAGISPST